MQRRVCILSVAVTLCCLGSVKSSFWTPPNEVACRDPNGVALDWWMLIKLPSGGSYVYADSSTATPGWSFSETRSLTEERQNPIFNTLRHLYENDGPVREVASVLYNDEPPYSPASSYRAHAKGVLAVGPSSGFWITHSIPKFPPPPGFPYTFPIPEQRLAQSAFCLTLTPPDIDHCLVPSLMVSNVDTYYSNISSRLEVTYPRLAALLAGRHVLGSATLSCRLSSAVGVDGWIFSKTRSWGGKLFRDLVHPFFSEGMVHQSWRLGRGRALPSCCPPRCRFEDLSVIGVAVQEAMVGWKSSVDHGKWGVSLRPGSNIVCLSDLNHMASQMRRGGGALCVRSAQLWDRLNGTVAAVEQCSDGCGNTSVAALHCVV